MDKSERAMHTARSVRRRYRRERRFVACAAACMVAALLFLGVLFADIAGKGWRGFLSASIKLETTIDAALIGAAGEKSALSYQKLARRALRERFPRATSRAAKKQLNELLGFYAAVKFRDLVLDNPDWVGKRIAVWLPLKSEAAAYLKGAGRGGKLKDAHIARLETLRRAGESRVHFNFGFFVNSDSRDPEAAGIFGALLGSAFSLLLAFLFSFPTAVLAAVYLELLAPRNRWFDLIEINLNNLAAVPSVIFGLLGLLVFINFFGLPRSSPLVGGLVLSLMTLPTLIIAARAAIKSAPDMLLPAAMSLGATKLQAIFHHVLPAAMPGILTGAIIGMAQALGETAPLLMIGMVAFIARAPSGILDQASALPAQILLWADSPERGFEEKTAAAIIVLLVFLLAMNLAAILLRKRLEIKW